MPRFRDVGEAIRVIERNRGQVNRALKIIKVRGAGLKVLAAIDFLVNHHKFTRIG